ncbi:MAG: MBL fold metallo-hydrolase [Methyloligellaceae bacterium]
MLGLSGGYGSNNQALAKSTKHEAGDKNIQAPGYYKFKLGEFTITIISDGSFQLPAASLGANVPEAQVNAFLKSNLADTTSYTAHTNSCIIDTGKKVILVEAGAGSSFSKTTGMFDHNLKSAGYSHDEIDMVVFTHAEPDNIWGVLGESKSGLRFPKATYYINSTEWDHWMQEDLEKKAPDNIAKTLEKTRKALSLIASKSNRIKSDEELVAGVKAIDTSGHTKGHISLVIKSLKETMIISGDTLYHPYVSFEHPEWHMAGDMDPEKAVASRKALLDRAIAEEALLLGFHLPFPGIGRVARNSKNYRWFPEIWKWEV